MRIVHFTRSFSPLSQTFIYDYITELERQGTESIVVTLNRENEAERPFGAVEVVSLPARWHPTWLRQRLRARGRHAADPEIDVTWSVRRKALAERIGELQPDLVHAHFGPSGVHLLPLTEELGIPLVVTFYGHDASRLLRDPTWVERYRASWSRFARVTVLSEAMREVIVGSGCPPWKCVVVRVAKRLPDYRFSPPTHPVRRFVSVGRLVEKKGHMDVLRAMRALRSSSADISLTIIGEGPLRGELERSIEEWDLQDRVTLSGPRSHAQVVDAMYEADAFVLASRTSPDGDQEGTPVVLLEAQAMGLPCVSTRHSGIPEQIPSSSHWLLAEEGDWAGIAERMQALAACTVDQLQSIARAGRLQVEQEYNLVTEVGKLRALYADVVERVASDRPG